MSAALSFIVLLLCAASAVNALRTAPLMMSTPALALNSKGKRVVIVGATGYIGKYVVKESVRQGSYLSLTLYSLFTHPLFTHPSLHP